MVLRPDQFTEQAQEVLATSQEIVRRYKHRPVGLGTHPDGPVGAEGRSPRQDPPRA